MNVYVRELVSSLAQAGVDCTTFTRATSADQPEVVHVEPGHRVVHVPAGPFDLRKEDLPSVIDAFADAVSAHLDGDFPADVLPRSPSMAPPKFVAVYSARPFVELPNVASPPDSFPEPSAAPGDR